MYAGFQVRWDLAQRIDKDLQIAKCIRSYFWSQTFAYVSINFRVPDKGSVLDTILFRKVQWTWNYVKITFDSVL